MRFPHNRNGYSNLGRMDAQELASIDVPFLHRQRNGALSQKKDDQLYVTLNAKVGLFLTSAYDGTALKHIVVGRDVVANFGLRGKFGIESTDGGASPLQYPVSFYGAGRAQLVRIQKTTSKWLATPWYGDIDKYTLSAYTSADGRTFALGFNNLLITTNAFNPSPVQVLGGGWVGYGVRTFRAEYAALTINDAGQIRTAYLVRDSKVSAAYFPEVANWRQPMRPAVQRAGPNSRIMLRRYAYSAQAAGQPADTANPLQFSWSGDAGTSWNPLAVSDMDAPVTDLIARVNAAIPVASERNIFLIPIVQATTFQVAPLNAFLGLITMTVPYAFTDGAALYGFSVNMRVVTGVIDLISGFVSSTSVAYDSRLHAGEGYNLAQYFVHQLIPVKGGVVAVTRPTPGVSGAPNYAGLRTMQFTSDGMTFSGARTMPGISSVMGRVTATSALTLVCPMFDGVHSLYATKDRGATWARVCTIASTAFFPAPGASQWELLQFNNVVRLLGANGRPSSMTPAAPWATDARIAPP